uniref:Uncharacterized protein n=1 Tax=viral metagenome TaxID=1070528 RepID=A0A6H1ZVV5_9ZZZZ
MKKRPKSKGAQKRHNIKIAEQRAMRYEKHLEILFRKFTGSNGHNRPEPPKVEWPEIDESVIADLTELKPCRLLMRRFN